MAAQRAEDETVIVEQLGGSRRASEHRADELQRFDIAPLLMTQQAEQMQRIEMPGLRSEDGVADRLGIGELSLLIMQEGLCDAFGR